MVGICGTSCEDLPTYVSSSLAYHAHVTVDSDKSCVCHDKLVNKQFAVLPHDDESSHQLVHSLAGYYCIYCTNKFCCPTKVFSDLLLPSGRAVKLLAQQANSPLNKVCTSETEQNLFGAFSPERSC